MNGTVLCIPCNIVFDVNGGQWVGQTSEELNDYLGIIEEAMKIVKGKRQPARVGITRPLAPPPPPPPPSIGSSSSSTRTLAASSHDKIKKPAIPAATTTAANKTSPSTKSSAHQRRVATMAAAAAAAAETAEAIALTAKVATDKAFAIAAQVCLIHICHFITIPGCSFMFLNMYEWIGGEWNTEE